MKITQNQVIGGVVTVAAIAFGGYYVYQNRPVDLSKEIQQNPVDDQGDNGIIGEVQHIDDGKGDDGKKGNSNMPDLGEKLKDERVQITDQEKETYKSSVMLNLKKNEQMYGTSYVVDKNTVVTNKHVVYGYENKPEAIEARVGHLDKNGKFTYTTFEVEKIFVPKKETMDVAVLTLKPRADGTRVGDLRKPVKFGDGNSIKVGDTISIIGYPGDKPFGSLWDSTGTVASNSFPLFLKALTSAGNSGSPIFNAKGEVVAMLNAGGENMSFGFPITQEIMDFIQSHTK